MVINYFSVLGLKPGVTEDEIKKSFRKLALQWHPDKNQAVGAEDKFKEISAAYEYLQSKDRRELLERDLTRKQEPSNNTTTSSYFSTQNTTAKKNSESYTSSSQTQSAKKEENKSSGVKKDGNFHWTKSFFGKGNQEKSQEKKKSWRPEGTSRNKNEEAEHPPKFSSAFRSFVDHLDAEFDSMFTDTGFDSAFFDSEPGVKEDLDPTKIFSRSTLPTSKKRKSATRRRCVAHETGGVDDLDEDYLFSSRHGHDQVSDDSDMSSDGEYGYNADVAGARLPCHYCGKLYRQYKLIHHEEKCGKFGASPADEKTSRGWTPTAKPTGDWRQTHEDLLTNIRRAKQSAKAKSTDDSNVSVACSWCGRLFSKESAKRHIPFCERWSKQQGFTVNGSYQSPTEPSKSEKSRQYTKKVPRPGHQAKPRGSKSRANLNDASDEETTPTKSNHYHGNKHMKQESRSRDDRNSNYTSRTYSTNQRGQKSSDPKVDSLGINGERFGNKCGNHDNSGCVICRSKYGSNAKFVCSCGTKIHF